jgi:L-serine dehydratase
MNVFDIIGPIMVGPSSSHTAGAVRIGRIARALLNEEPCKVQITFHGSFARTYKGHGTDKAILGGLLGMRPDDRRIKDSLELAKQMGMSYCFKTADLGDVHPNTVLISTMGSSREKLEVLGSSVGGGNVLIRRVNGLEVDFTGANNTLLVFHRDTPGAVAAVTQLLAREGINIAQMKVFRFYRGGNAVMVIETDQSVQYGLTESIKELSFVTFTTIIPAV